MKKLRLIFTAIFLAWACLLGLAAPALADAWVSDLLGNSYEQAVRGVLTSMDENPLWIMESSIVVTPEPASMVLLGSALGALAARRFKKNKARSS